MSIKDWLASMRRRENSQDIRRGRACWRIATRIAYLRRNANRIPDDRWADALNGAIAELLKAYGYDESGNRI